MISDGGGAELDRVDDCSLFDRDDEEEVAGALFSRSFSPFILLSGAFEEVELGLGLAWDVSLGEK